MKILLTGGGSGGHFYPIIAVAEAVNEISKEEKLLPPQLFYMAETPYNSKLLFENNLEFKQVPAGKVRGYFSILNFFDLFKTGWGIVKAIFKVFSIYPDVVFGKGGYASFPALFAARIFRIPVVIHESDSVPGKVNLWASKFAEKIAISYPEAAGYFPKKVQNNIANTGNPVRKNLLTPLHTGAHEYLHLNPDIPVILILGGSQGSKKINDTLLDVLPRLVEKYQIIHQVGRANYDEIKGLTDVVLLDNKNRDRYKLFDYLDDLALRMSAGAASVVVSRAGASAIAEIAAWKIPSVLIPITNSNGDHQRKNAFAYAREGGATVIEERSLTPSILYSEIDILLQNPEKRKQMSESAGRSADPDAAKKIAHELLMIALKHES